MIATFLLIIIYISFISLGLPDSLLGSAWPSMYRGLAVPMSYAGIVSMLIAGCTIISSLFSSRIIRRFGTGLVTTVSVFMTAFALFAFSLSNHFIFLCIFAIPFGLGAGSVDTGLNNYIALHYKAKHMSWLHCFWGIGATTGPVVMAYFLLHHNSWHMGYLTISILQFILALVLIFSLPLWKKVNKNVAASEIVPRKSLTFREIFKIPGTRQAALTFFCYCTVEQTAGLWGSSYLVTARGIASETAASWIALYYLGITVGRFLSGFLTMRFNQRQMVRFGQMIIVSGIVLLFLPFGNALLLPGLLLIGLGCAPIFPSILHETPVNFGEKHSQTIMGIQMASAYAGTTLMPPFFGYLASQFNYHLFPYFLAVFTVFIMISVHFLHRRVDAVHV